MSKNLRVFKTKEFHKWAKKIGIKDAILAQSLSEVELGLVDAKLGANLYKKRVPLPGKGKRGATRTLLAYKKDDKSIFLYGFEKNIKSNINEEELEVLKKICKLYFSYSEAQISIAIKGGELIEVKYEKEYY